jgi:crotonobetainyl-CoA:carnitine CoA-transferase CaiB-like acyl-CoA transferase
MEHPKHEPFKMPAWPVRVDGKTAKVKASPILGQHVTDVLTNWLGMSAFNVETLKADGIV